MVFVDLSPLPEGSEVWSIEFRTAKGTYAYRNPFTFTYGAVTKRAS